MFEEYRLTIKVCMIILVLVTIGTPTDKWQIFVLETVRVFPIRKTDVPIHDSQNLHAKLIALISKIPMG